MVVNGEAEEHVHGILTAASWTALGMLVYQG